MKKLFIAIPFVIVLAGCSSNPDAKFADHAPAVDSGTTLTSYAAAKPAIPAPKPDVRTPKILH